MIDLVDIFAVDKTSIVKKKLKIFSKNELKKKGEINFLCLILIC
jgi:hypothetical protein